MRAYPQLQNSYWPADTGAALWHTTAGALLQLIATEVPDRVALVDGVADPAKRRRWTYAELLAVCEQTAQALLQRFAPGERIAICAPNCAEYVLLQYGLNIAGLVMVPINPAYKAAELLGILRNAAAVGIFYAPRFRDNDLRAAISAIRPALANLREAVSMPDFEAFISGYDAATPLPTIAPEAMLQLQFTSGTSGVPKGACLHHLGTLNTSRFVALRAGFPEGGVWLNAMPMFHVGGSVVSALGTLASRGTFVIAPGFEPALMLELIEAERANAALFVPTMIINLLDHPDFARRNLTSMKVILTGAAIVPAALVRRTKSAFGCGLVILFGQTEVNGVVSQTTREDSIEDQAQTMGQPLPRAEVKIVDVDTGDILPIGTPGEICVRGYQIMHGYCGLDEAAKAAIADDGWWGMGDIGTMDHRGYLRITGRLKDMIIRGGMNIYPREIEDVLFDHPEVAEVSVVGVRDEIWGEIVAAVIRPETPAAPPPPENLHAFCRTRLASHKTPAMWFFVEAYPMTPSGKIQKFILQDWIGGKKLSPVTWRKPDAAAAR